ncbi:hypothetical protein FIBSPDRAFT_933907 [Athelia psychrophila]|uniref:Uncharacterized protein n=1 Tax=Athelia psychrophila TaxID=1759441 RepID=A0A166GD08_9AGAM|nr:hypothetical protein FIBSPDRAFT_933907 [Fibularhizoctonia sp. CBS 109695]
MMFRDRHDFPEYALFGEIVPYNAVHPVCTSRGWVAGALGRGGFVPRFERRGLLRAEQIRVGMHAPSRVSGKGIVEWRLKASEGWKTGWLDVLTRPLLPFTSIISTSYNRNTIAHIICLKSTYPEASRYKHVRVSLSTVAGVTFTYAISYNIIPKNVDYSIEDNINNNSPELPILVKRHAYTEITYTSTTAMSARLPLPLL